MTIDELLEKKLRSKRKESLKKHARSNYHDFDDVVKKLGEEYIGKSKNLLNSWKNKTGRKPL